MNESKSIQQISIMFCVLILASIAGAQEHVYKSGISGDKPKQAYPIVDTGQQRCYDNTKEIRFPKRGQPFYGQDAQY